MRLYNYWLFALKLAPAVITAAAGLVTLRMVYPSSEAVRIRNSLIYEPIEAAELSWDSAHQPDTFKRDFNEPPADFRSAGETIAASLPAGSPDLSRGLAIGRYLAKTEFKGQAIQRNSVDTLHGIVDDAQGYCADFAQVFDGLAYALQLTVREWGMSFDGFGGNGHAFNEIFDTERQRWVFIDPYFSFYAVDKASGEPLSVLELFNRLHSWDGRHTVSVVPISQDRFLFDNHDTALDYYTQGMEGLFLWWGNNVFEYDDAPLVRLAGSVSRSLEQIAAIASGVHPQMRIVRSADNAADIAALRETRNRFLFMATITVIAGGLLLIQILGGVRMRSIRRRAAAVAAAPGL